MILLEMTFNSFSWQRQNISLKLHGTGISDQTHYFILQVVVFCLLFAVYMTYHLAHKLTHTYGFFLSLVGTLETTSIPSRLIINRYISKSKFFSNLHLSSFLPLNKKTSLNKCWCWGPLCPHSVVFWTNLSNAISASTPTRTATTRHTCTWTVCTPESRLRPLKPSWKLLWS